MKARIPITVAALAAAGLIPVAASAASAASPASGTGHGSAGSWQPEPASYGVSQPVDIRVRMDDGVVITTEVVFPTDPAMGARAAGVFPVLLTQNRYGTARSDPTPQELASLAGGSYTVGYGAAAASVLDLPLASPGQFTASPVDWGPSS